MPDCACGSNALRPGRARISAIAPIECSPPRTWIAKLSTGSAFPREISRSTPCECTRTDNRSDLSANGKTDCCDEGKALRIAQPRLERTLQPGIGGNRPQHRKGRSRKDRRPERASVFRHSSVLDDGGAEIVGQREVLVGTSGIGRRERRAECESGWR